MHTAPEAVPTAARAAPARSWAEDARRDIDSYLAALLSARRDASALAPLADAMAYETRGGGKRLRPLLVLAVAGLYREIDEDARALAAATELIHAASLALDDLPSMDNASVRRGKPATHTVFGESTATLAALALWSEAARLVASVKDAPVDLLVREMALAVGTEGLVGGQFLDLASFGRPQTLTEVEDLSYRKTGALLALAVRLGALFGGASESERASLERFGRAFGELYQVRDDLVDALMTPEAAGKDVRIDARNGRTTFATLLGVAGARERIRALAAQARAALAELPHATGRLEDLIITVETI